MIYKFDPNKHKDPVYSLDLNLFYYIIHKNKLLIFVKRNLEENVKSRNEKAYSQSTKEEDQF